MAGNAGIKIGLVTTLAGPTEALGRDAIVGAQLALDEFGGRVADKTVKFLVAGSNAIPDSAVDAARDLLDRDQCDFVIGPLSGNEGLAVRDFAATRPERAFLNGCAAAQDITLRTAAPNFFNFSPNAVQDMAGLGEYVYQALGYRRMVTLAEDYSYPYGLIGGFMIEFCRFGGKIVKRFWVPLGKKSFKDFFASVPRDVDAILVCLTGTDAIEFIREYAEAQVDIPLVGGSSTFEPAALKGSGSLAAPLVGTPSASAVSEDNPDPRWQTFLRAYREQSAHGAAAPSLPTYGYYLNTKAALLVLEAIGGEFTAGQANFKAGLTKLEFESPTGTVRLDHNRQAIIDTFVSVLDRHDDGTFFNRMVKRTPQVNQTLGIPESDYLLLGPLNRDTDVETWLGKLKTRG